MPVPDGRDDAYDELWDEEFDPDWSPPEDAAERLAAIIAAEPGRGCRRCWRPVSRTGIRRRLASWAAAGEVDVVGELARRRTVQAKARKNPRLLEHIGDELAAALTLTGRSADRLLGLSAELERLPDGVGCRADRVAQGRRLR